MQGKTHMDIVVTFPAAVTCIFKETLYCPLKGATRDIISVPTCHQFFNMYRKASNLQ